MSAALVVIAVISGLVVLLAVPLDMAFQVEGGETFNGQIGIRWLYGLVRLRIRLPRERKASAAPQAAETARRRRTQSKQRGRLSDVLRVLRQAAFRQRIYRLMHDLARAAQLRDLALRLRLGLGDPADTGRLWALVGPLNAAAQSIRNAEVTIEPAFMEAALELRAQGRVLVVPLRILLLAVGFALSPASIRAWRTLQDSRA